MAEISSCSSRYFGKIQGKIFHAFYLEDSFNIGAFQKKQNLIINYQMVCQIQYYINHSLL